MDSVTQKARLEKALRIALLRAHGGDEKYALFLCNNLEDDAEAPEYAPRPYQGWQDAKRLVNQLEALEAAHGVRHVRIKYRLRDAYRTGEFYA
jgi:hypothetical protein